ncbi:MAG: hypothetical protein DMF09_07775 [Verrucomicrobia bacterium]|nr:MAG: hypothetical protein DMF09_07775 [Verrucomicrobiota bacterium]
MRQFFRDGLKITQLSTCQKRGTKLQSWLMRIWGIVAVAALAITSFGAENVAPTKSELEQMYNKAFREFDANNFPQALKELDALDARQPDLAASQNLRGVILMRQGIYDKAEAALLEAARIDPKFWNARFNLAEIPFLQKNWEEARNRFQKLLSSSQSDLASEATQLVQYKILLTYLLEGKENMVDSILAKLELSSDTPAVQYVKAAVALQHKNDKEAKDWMAVAEKNFSPQLNKLFVESFYEVGWLERPGGEGRASMPLMTAAERKEKAKATGRAKFEEAQQALRQRDLGAARKLIDEADQAEPNQPATLNLRGEILMEQKEFDQAEASFKKAAKLDPKFREAQYNLAQVPFKKKDYAKARERFEALFERTPGGDKNQAAELIKFKIYMTLLLEGKESRAQSMMEQFQFTGDTPALYYAQAAWEFRHNNGEKAADWVASAKKIYSQGLNNIFADALYDAGWMQAPEVASAPAFEAGSLVAESGSAPAIEPSPIPDGVAAANKREATAKAESVASSGLVANPPVAGTKVTSLEPAAEQASVFSTKEPSAAGLSQPEASPAPVTGSSPGEESTATTAAPNRTPIASSATLHGQNDQSAVSQPNPSPAPVVATSPATTVAPTKISQPSVIGTASRRTWFVAGLLLAGIFLLAGVVVSQRRRYTFNIPSHFPNGSLIGSRTSNLSKPTTSPLEKGVALGNGFFAGPRQVSLQLTASKPLMQRTVLRLTQSHRAFDSSADLRGSVSQAQAYQNAEADHKAQQVTAPVLGGSAGLVAAEAEGTVAPVVEPVAEPQFEAIDQGQPVAQQIPISATEHPAIAEVAVGPSYSPNISNAPVSSPTTSLTMPEQSEQPQPAEVPLAADAARPVSAAHTPVQLTFSFEIVSVQLTRTFKVRTLQVRPASKIVTMRLASSQRSQPQIHPQVAFEVAKIEPADSGLGTVRLIKSTRQRQQLAQQPVDIALPSFEVTALQPISSSDAAAMVQLAPSEPGKAHVQVTADFQMAEVEFSTCFEITGVVLNSTSSQVSVQLAGADPSAIEGAPVFNVANVRLTGSGDSEILELDAI